MRITQRQVTLGLMIVLFVGTALLTLSLVFSAERNLTLIGVSIASLLLMSALFGVYWRGWEPARYLMVFLITLAIGISTSNEYLTDKPTLAIFLPPVIALIVAGPWWIAGSAITVISLLIARAGGGGVYAELGNLSIFSIIIGGIVLARIVTSSAQAGAEENARRAEDALAMSEEQAHELAEANQRANIQLDEQQKLLDLVATLEVPTVQLADGVLFAPVVGHLDTRRTQELTARLLDAAHTQRARLIVLDIAGVSIVDTTVARALLSAAQALRLLGCQVAISGVSANVAITLTHLGISLEGITTVRSPQEALAQRLGTAPAKTTTTELLPAPPTNGKHNGNGMTPLN